MTIHGRYPVILHERCTYRNVQVVLQLRLYAMYGSSIRIFAFFVFLLACEITALAVLFGKSIPGQVGESRTDFTIRKFFSEILD